MLRDRWPGCAADPRRGRFLGDVEGVTRRWQHTLYAAWAGSMTVPAASTRRTTRRWNRARIALPVDHRQQRSYDEPVRRASTLMTLRPRYAAFSQAILLAGFCAGSLRAQDGRALVGIAHVALRVGDVAKSRAFYGALGWQQAFEISDDKGTTTSYLKVSDRQFIELYRRDNPSDPLGLMHICLETGDISRVIAAYTALGLSPTDSRKARAGNLLFNLRDPEGQLIEYTQYLPGSLHYNDRGKHLNDSRISEHMIEVTLTVKDVGAEEAFFTGKLGFQGSGLKLSVPGTPGEAIVLAPQAVDSKPSLKFAADPRLAAEKLKMRGLEVKVIGGVPVVLDPNGASISFNLR